MSEQQQEPTPVPQPSPTVHPPTPQEEAEKYEGPFYAWSRIEVERDEQGKATRVINPGDQVSPGDVDLDEDEFNREYVDSGVVKKEEYPSLPKDYADSPANYIRNRQQREMMIADLEAQIRELEEENEREEQNISQ